MSTNLSNLNLKNLLSSPKYGLDWGSEILDLEKLILDPDLASKKSFQKIRIPDTGMDMQHLGISDTGSRMQP